MFSSFDLKSIYVGCMPKMGTNKKEEEVYRLWCINRIFEIHRNELKKKEFTWTTIMEKTVVAIIITLFSLLRCYYIHEIIVCAFWIYISPLPFQVFHYYCCYIVYYIFFVVSFSFFDAEEFTIDFHFDVLVHNKCLVYLLC